VGQTSWGRGRASREPPPQAVLRKHNVTIIHMPQQSHVMRFDMNAAELYSSRSGAFYYIETSAYTKDWVCIVALSLLTRDVSHVLYNAAALLVCAPQCCITCTCLYLCPPSIMFTAVCLSSILCSRESLARMIVSPHLPSASIHRAAATLRSSRLYRRSVWISRRWDRLCHRAWRTPSARWETSSEVSCV
jgi:hypothetical protein